MTGPSPRYLGADDPLWIEDGSGVNNLPDDGNKPIMMKEMGTRRKARLHLGPPNRRGANRQQQAQRLQRVGPILLGRRAPNLLQQVARLHIAQTMIVDKAGVIIDP